MHFLNIIKDEICAAGLDGIPISHLWCVLQEPLVKFPIEINATTKEFLWDRIRRFENFDFFLRSKDPPPYVYFDRFKSGDKPATCLFPTSERKLYPVKSNVVLGSCADFKTRVRVNAKVAAEDLSYEAAYKMWGDRLVVVAPQRMRTYFLTGSDVLHPSINAKLYRVLELVAKSRYNGIPISGDDGVLSFGESSSTVFYIRKLFSASGLIKSQPFITYDSAKSTMRRTTLLHCFRYFRPMTYPLALVMEQVSNLLSESPAKMLLPYTIRQKFSMGRRSFMRIVKFGVQQGCLRVIHVPFGTACALVSGSEGDPTGEVCELLRKEALELSVLDSTATSAMTTTTETQGRRYVREAAVIYLQHPFHVQNYMSKVHVDRGSRPDAITAVAKSAEQEDLVECSMLGDNDVTASGPGGGGDDGVSVASAPFYSPRVNGEETFCVQVCRHLCEHDQQPNSQLAAHFNTSHKLISRYADGLAGAGKLFNSKVSTGTTFSLVRKYITEKEALELHQAQRESRLPTIISVANQREQRRLFILESLDTHRVFRSLLDLRARIWAHEESLGLRGRMDRKSLARIVDELVRDGRLKFIDMEIAGRKHDGSSRKINLRLVCHPEVEVDSPELVQCVMLEKRRYMLPPKSYGALKPEEAMATTTAASEGSGDEEEAEGKFSGGGGGDDAILSNQNTGENRWTLTPALGGIGVSPLKTSSSTTTLTSTPLKAVVDIALTKTELELIRLPDKNISKLRRRCLLHKFLFYLLHELPVNTAPLPLSVKPWAPVYNGSSVMYRYVPPIPRNALVPGWISFHDVIQAMPLGLFLALSAPTAAPRLLLQWLSMLKGGEASLRSILKRFISNQADQAAEFSPYRGKGIPPDTLRRFELLRTPVSHCPVPGGHAGALFAWLMSRFNVNRIYAVVEQLSSHGLLTLNGQSTTQGHLPMANIFLHHKAALLDTRFAAPAHHLLSDISACPPLLTYELKSIADVESYWLNLRAILMFTPYGFSRFADPTIGQFRDAKAPILSVERLRDALEREALPASLPVLTPTVLRSFSPASTAAEHSRSIAASEKSVLRVVMSLEEKRREEEMEAVVLRGVGGLHASLYLFRAPFEEMGYGTTEQGHCTQYAPAYPSPSLQLQPVVREEEMRALLGTFEPGLKTLGDGAFWPWTVQLFFDTKPVHKLPRPPVLPSWLFTSRARRFPFRIAESEEDGTSEAGFSLSTSRRKRPRRLRSSHRRKRRRQGDGASSATSGSESDDSAGSDASNSDGSRREKEEDVEEDSDLQVSPFEELQPIVKSRNLRLRKKKTSTVPHIHRNAFKRQIMPGDRRAMDERDVEIRNSLHSRRASWNKWEDQVLLSCRVASLFLVGHTREYVCIPYVVVRDMLYEYFPLESHDKTSLACSRRLKFLLFLRNDERTKTDILLTKVSSDPEMIAKYNIGKAAWVHLYNMDAKKAHQLFKDLVRLIIRNFQPELSARCQHVVNKALYIPRPRSLFDGATEEDKATEASEAEASAQVVSKALRETLLSGSREALRARYDFVLLASINNDRQLPDIGRNRPAIVVETLRNYFMGAIRFRPELGRPHDSVLFNRVLKQYPYEQMNAAVKCLAQTDSLRKNKASEDSDLIIAKHFRVKLTLRLSSWCNIQLSIYISFFMETWKIQRQLYEESRRIRSRLRRQKQKLNSTSADAAEPEKTDWVVMKHDFTEPTSGGMVATFLELLYSQSQVKLRVKFDTSCISILRKPCMCLEDRKRVVFSGTDDEASTRQSKQLTGKLNSMPHFGESTHIGMTMALLEGSDGKNATSALTETLMEMFLNTQDQDGDGGGEAPLLKGKTPRIDIRLSLNGGTIEAIAPTISSHVTVVDGEAEHKKLCRRVLAKFLAPLKWDAVKAKELTNQNKAFGGGSAEENATLIGGSNEERALKIAEFIFAAGDLGVTMSQVRERFSDTKITVYVVRKLLEEQKIFLLGLAEPRFVHWAHLRLWLVHIKETKNAPSSGENANLTPPSKRVRICLPDSNDELATSTPLPSDRTATTAAGDGAGGEAKDYYFIPQPWIDEGGHVKGVFFVHLLLSICSMTSRYSGATMEFLASQYGHLLSPVSFRLLCHVLYDAKIMRIVRTTYNPKCTLFSKPESVILRGDQVLLAPASELTVSLEPHFVSRSNALLAAAAEALGVPPNKVPEAFSTSTYIQSSRPRNRQNPLVLQPVVRGTPEAS